MRLRVIWTRIAREERRWACEGGDVRMCRGVGWWEEGREVEEEGGEVGEGAGFD